MFSGSITCAHACRAARMASSAAQGAAGFVRCFRAFLARSGAPEAGVVSVATCEVTRVFRCARLPAIWTVQSSLSGSTVSCSKSHRPLFSSQCAAESGLCVSIAGFFKGDNHACFRACLYQKRRVKPISATPVIHWAGWLWYWRVGVVDAANCSTCFQRPSGLCSASGLTQCSRSLMTTGGAGRNRIGRVCQVRIGKHPQPSEGQSRTRCRWVPCSQMPLPVRPKRTSRHSG